jgi:hypothetical protein
VSFYTRPQAGRCGSDTSELIGQIEGTLEKRSASLRSELDVRIVCDHIDSPLSGGLNLITRRLSNQTHRDFNHLDVNLALADEVVEARDYQATNDGAKEAKEGGAHFATDHRLSLTAKRAPTEADAPTYC